MTSFKFGHLEIVDAVIGTRVVCMISAVPMRLAMIESSCGVNWYSVYLCGKSNFGMGQWAASKATTSISLKVMAGCGNNFLGEVELVLMMNLLSR